MSKGVPPALSERRIVSIIKIITIITIMCTTIREKQKRQLLQSLRSPQFGRVIAHLKTHGSIGCCAPEGQWYLTQNDLDDIFTADGRGIHARMVDTYLELYIVRD